MVGGVARWRLVLVLLLLTPIAAPNKILFKISDGFGDNYMIAGYAMDDATDYQTLNITKTGMCRRACQAKIDCHSVSMVPTTGTENECRISTKPANIGDKTQRPRLKRTPGAFHFLAAVKGTNEWITLLDDGFKWRTESNTYIWSFRLNGARLAILSSLHQVKLAMRDTTVNRPYYVDLSRTGTDQPVWNAGGGNVKYNDTDLDPTRIQDDPNLSNSKFYFTHDGSQYTFVGTSGSTKRVHLQQYNYLNLWE